MQLDRIAVVLRPRSSWEAMELGSALVRRHAAAVWVPMGWGQVAGLALAALFATAGHYTMTRAFAVAPMAVTQPVTFLQLIWASLLGVTLFHEPMDPMVLLGGAIIIAAISFITWREARASQRRSQ